MLAKGLPVVLGVQWMEGWMLRCRLDDVRWIESCVFSSGIVFGEVG